MKYAINEGYQMRIVIVLLMIICIIGMGISVSCAETKYDSTTVINGQVVSQVHYDDGDDQTPIGGDMGWYVFHCPQNGVEIYLDQTSEGQITDGELAVPVYTTATPYTTYTVKYMDCSESVEKTYDLPGVPAKGQTLNVYVSIQPSPCPTPVPTVIGGDEGWLIVHCNINDASVFFDNDYKGQTVSGGLSVPIYLTGTPYTSLSVMKKGYQTATDPIQYYPNKGQSLDVYVTLNRETGTDGPIVAAESNT